MFLDKKIEIVISPSNIKHYSKYYDDLKVKDKIFVFHEELNKSSSALIKVKCDECGKEKELKFKNYSKYGYNDGYYLCRSCKMKKNNKEKYGVENIFQLEEIKEKSKNTIKEKYNVENISQSNEIKRKKIETNLDRYGVEWGLSSNKIKEKSKNTIKEKYNIENISQNIEVKKKKEETCFKNHNVCYISQDEKFKEKLKNENYKKYGVEYAFQSEEIKNKIKETNIKKYNFDNPSKSKEIKRKISSSVLKTLHKKMFDSEKNLIKIKSDSFILKCENKNHNYEINKILYYKRRETNTILCTKCNPVSKNISGLEIELLNFIKNFNFKIIKNSKKIISPYELDIYLPELKIAFEFNGVYWHNELNKPKNYHKEKTDLCNKKGINLIHIWEDDWIYKKEIVKSIILNKLNMTKNKIYARNCEIREIKDIQIIRNFLNKNHIQGYCKSKYKLGLFYNNELVSLMLFGKSRNYELELLRFCTKLNLIVVGGASKLFNFFIKNYNFNEIITYTDKSISNGNLYEKLKFKLIKETKPEYYYVVYGIRKHKSNFRKTKLIKEGYNKKLSEHEIMIQRNIFRIYNSGYLKFKYSKNADYQKSKN